MILDDAFGLALAFVALVCYAALFTLRTIRDREGSRLLFVDLLLVVAAVEIIADDLHTAIPFPWHEIALITRGALVASAIALLYTGREP